MAGEGGEFGGAEVAVAAEEQQQGVVFFLFFWHRGEKQGGGGPGLPRQFPFYPTQRVYIAGNSY